MGTGVIQALRRLLSRDTLDDRSASVPDGQRVYAIGDIHGQIALFSALREAIERDIAAAPHVSPLVILLGDLVDRGPGSAHVIESARAWGERQNVRYLCGNHEEMFLRSLEDETVLRQFLRHGGRETLFSYGISEAEFAAATLPDIQELARKAIPADHLEFLSGFENMIEIGDYLFVHAGVAPGVALEEQRTSDLRWIREPFLSHEGDHGRVIVHGHTIVEQPVVRVNRVGIDTGAYRTGRLTALVLEGTGRRFLEALATDGAITVTSREAE